jgi:apolipoprotein N-acyltransferase
VSGETVDPWSAEDLYPALAGLLMALSFPPINLSFLAFVALVPLFLYLDKPATLTRTVRAGVLCSIVYFGMELSWVNAMGTFSWLAFPGYLAILLGLHVPNFFFFVIPIVVLRNYISMPFLYSAPFAWVICERLRCYGDLSFPWCTFGYSLTRFPFLLQFADLTGIYGVSFWLVVLNVLLFEAMRACRQPAKWRKYVIAWVFVFGSVNLYNAFRWFKGIGPPSGQITVAVVQPNIPQRLKWDDRYSRQVLEKIFALNATALETSADLIVWPETAIPYYVNENRPFDLAEMGELPKGKAHILTGLLDSAADSRGQTRFYNAAALFDSRGTMLERYKKIYLVPGSERYPFRRLLGFTRSFFKIQDISYGAMDSGHDATVFTLPRARFSVMICYESAFPELSRTFRRRGSNFLVNITNDAWFGRSFAPYQHASFLVLRAIENRTAIARCGNTGISGFLDPLGRWQQKTTLNTEAILAGTIPLTAQLTFYTRFGDLIVYVSFAALGLFLIMALKKKYAV